MKKHRNTPQPSPVTFYLGSGSDRKRRIDRLDEQAAELGVTRSVLLQMIADDKLEVRRREPAQQSA